MAVVLAAAVLSGCFGYNRSAKRWAYAGDTLLILGGGGAITADLVTPDAPCTTGQGCPTYTSPVGGALVAGVMLVTIGLIGIVLNATRPILKTSQ
ncbi:MAG: hypothetical protein H0T79_00100 [Deltaproteobacteria bacterium]|nr:hypothetical protein [Deltaproteobacteria bacterium]